MARARKAPTAPSHPTDEVTWVVSASFRRPGVIGILSVPCWMHRLDQPLNDVFRVVAVLETLRSQQSRSTDVAPDEHRECRLVASRGGREQRRIRPSIVVQWQPWRQALRSRVWASDRAAAASSLGSVRGEADLTVFTGL